MNSTKNDSSARPSGHGGSQPWVPAFAPVGTAAVETAGISGIRGDFVADIRTLAPAAPALAPAERESLNEAFRGTLARGIHGLCFSPYLEGQQPGSQISEDQIQERLRIIQPHTRWIRTFSCTDGHEQTPRLAKALGLKTLVGAWLGIDREINARELAGAIAVARAGHALSLIHI